MFNYITVDFPGSEIPPQRVYEFKFEQSRFSHEVAHIKFRDWDVSYRSIKAGQPVTFNLKTTGSSRVFYGYVQIVAPVVSPGKDLVEMTVIGASYKLKQARQKVFTNVKAGDVIAEIAKTNGFSYEIEDHPRVYEQVAQAGHTDLEIMTRLALQCGYSLRVENTTIFFKPLDYDFKNRRESAVKLVMSNANDPGGSDIYMFNGTIGESNQFDDSFKAAYMVGGVDTYSRVPIQTKRETLPTYTRIDNQSEFFDRYATSIVAPNAGIAFYEQQALDKLNQYPYRAIVSVIGNPQLRPDMPVYLDGLGADYSGFWTVINATHIVVESNRNTFKYVTHLIVGSDSLNLAGSINGTVITAPTATDLRIIKSGELNIPLENVTVLNDANKPDSVTQPAHLIKLKNAKLAAIKTGIKEHPTWKSSKTNLKGDKARLRKRSAAAIDRLSRFT